MRGAGPLLPHGQAIRARALRTSRRLGRRLNFSLAFAIFLQKHTRDYATAPDHSEDPGHPTEPDHSAEQDDSTELGYGSDSMMDVD